MPPFDTVTIAGITAGALAFDWTLGANGLTYDTIYRWVLPFRSTRVPARFSAFVGCVLALLAAFGSARLFRYTAEHRLSTVVFAITVSAVLMDTRPQIKVIPYWRSVPSIYTSVTPDMVLAEFPFDHNADDMYFSLSHGARVLNGLDAATTVHHVASGKWEGADVRLYALY